MPLQFYRKMALVLKIQKKLLNGLLLPTIRDIKINISSIINSRILVP